MIEVGLGKRQSEDDLSEYFDTSFQMLTAGHVL